MNNRQVQVTGEVKKVQLATLKELENYANASNQMGAYVRFKLSGQKDFLVIDLRNTRMGKRVSGPKHPGVLFQLCIEGSLNFDMLTPKEFYELTDKDIIDKYFKR